MKNRHEQKVWWEDYKGVHVLVHRNNFTDIDDRPRFGWCFYLVLMKDQFDAETWAKICPKPKRMKYFPDSPVRADYNYYHLPIITGLDWHGEITFFERNFDQFGKVCSIRAGCDYSHHFDMDREYDIEEVMDDAHRCVDSLLDAYPEMRIRCTCKGGYYEKTDGAFSERGDFISNAGQDWREAQGWSRMPEGVKA